MLPQLTRWRVFFDHLHNFEPNLTSSHRSKECISKLDGLKQFMDHCCHIRKYVFSVKKCGEQDCSICSPPRLPPEIFSQLFHLPDPIPASGDHYKPFEEVYGTKTTEKHHPSFTEPGKGGRHGIPFSPNAQTARKLIMCTECLKPRVLYAQRKLSHHDEVFLDRLGDTYLYSCGSTLAGLECEIQQGDQNIFLTEFMCERILHVTQQ